MFDESLNPADDYGTTARDVDNMLKSTPKKIPSNNISTTTERAKSNLVESLNPETSLIEDNEAGIKVFVPFDFYDT